MGLDGPAAITNFDLAGAVAHLPGMTGNLLHRETSPYLLQHADNPVHWNSWGPEALDRAKTENKPILLSIGYAACHWCHVMAHESFEDEAIAALMNDLFVNVKVDREERPDLDQIYQSALQLFGQHGGWPLTMFLTPDGEPFSGGTYFPPENRFGRPGFPEVLRNIAEIYRTKPEKVRENVASLSGSLSRFFESAAGPGIPIEAIDHAAALLLKEIDPINGGVGGAPKFPNPSILELLWRGFKRTEDTAYRDAVALTLDRMCEGGIYDHLGGGFARYATDATWLVPHFEKMLYDNAQLIDLLVLAWQETKNPLYVNRVRETVGWALREMVAEGGGFAATLDADSDGEEGRFYVWSEPEIDVLLGGDAALFKRVYDVTPAGNWEGRTILNRSHLTELPGQSDEAVLAKCRQVLLAARTHRVWPGWDDKVLADWNGLMIAALAGAGSVFDEPEWIAAARRAFDFVTTAMTSADGRLGHSWRKGELKHSATLDDYANMIRAALALFEATGESATIEAAERWAAIVDAHYWDEAGGGYFFTADDAEALIVRTKNAADNATPSGNGTMAGALSRLYYLTGNDACRERAEAVIAAFAGELARNLFPLGTLLNATEFLARAVQIVIIGDRAEPKTQALISAAMTSPLPNRVLQVVSADLELSPGHPAAGKGDINGAPTVYVCRNATCSRPLTDAVELRTILTSR